MPSLIAMNQCDAADSVCVSERQFQRYQQEGCPGRPRNYVISEIVQWIWENKKQVEWDKRSVNNGDVQDLDSLMRRLPSVLERIVENGTPKEADSASRTLIALYRAKALDEIDNRPRSVSFQKEVIESLGQQAVSHLLGVTSRHIRDHRTPRKDDGTYSGPDAVQWLIEKKIQEARQKWEAESDELKTAKERQAEAKAIKLEEEAKGVQGTYVSKADVNQKMAEAFAAIRTTFETLPKAMAPALPEEIREMFLVDLQNEVRQRLRIAGQKISEL